MKLSAVYDVGVALLTYSSRAAVNKQSKDGLENVLGGRVCFAQSGRISKYPFIPLHLRVKLLQSRKENLET